MSSGTGDRNAESLRRVLLGIPGVAALALVLRLAASLAAYRATFDTGTVELMALHILKGARPLFFYGQHYMGALEAYLAAFFIWIFGVSDFAASLSPIAFSILWVVTTGLVFREIAGRRAGIAAALTLAVPGWVVMWYSIAPYGGYPAAFGLGTLVWWLSLRLLRGGLPRAGEWVVYVLMGLSAGLGVWCNYQVAPYLLVAGMVMARVVWRRRGDPGILARLGVSAAAAVGGAWPALRVLIGETSGRVGRFEWSWGYIKHTVRIAWHRCLPQLLFWRVHMPAAVKISATVLLIVAGIAALVVLLEARRRRAWLPLIFCLICLGLYLPHSLAAVGAPRYMIPFWTGLLAMLFGMPLSSPRKRLAGFGAVLLLLLAAFHLYEDAASIHRGARRRKASAASEKWLVKRARELGGRHVLLVGGPIFGHMGQTLSFRARGAVEFVSVFDERYQRGAQGAEADSGTFLACERGTLGKVRAALDDLQVDYDEESGGRYALFHDLQVIPHRRRMVERAGIKVKVLGGVSGDGGAVLDGRNESELSGMCDGHSGLLFDLGRVREVSSLWLCAGDWYRTGLPEGYELGVSRNGKRFEAVRRTPRRIAVAYTCGNQVFMKGYFGIMEIRFDPVKARYLKLIFTRAQRHHGTWRLNEVYIFARADEPAAAGGIEDEARRIAGMLQTRAVEFTIADRWLSARLWGLLPHAAGRPPVFPRFNPKFRHTLITRRVRPRSGVVIAPRRALADECCRILRETYGGDVVAGRDDLEYYSLIYLNDPTAEFSGDRGLLWTGHTLVTTTNKTSGVYRTDAEENAEPSGIYGNAPPSLEPARVTLDIGTGDDRRQLGFGWSRSERLGGRTARWISHMEAEAWFDLEKAGEGELEVTAAPFPAPNRRQNIGVFVNGEYLGSWICPTQMQFTTYRMAVPRRVLRHGRNRLILRLGYRRRNHPDKREIGLAVDRIVLRRR